MLQRIGRYEILERIATGGQGTVYKANDTVLDRIVAIKLFNQSVSDAQPYLEALQREAQLAAGLIHPNITGVHDFQVEDGMAYIVMEYIPDSLAAHLQNNQSIPYRQAVKITLQICSALAHAHARNVVHRDIKLQNILLTNQGDVKVSDFGIARALTSSTHSSTSSSMGTPFYMSPEQWEGREIDNRSDIYSLGILLYEMLSGFLPFRGEAIEAIYVQHREAPMPNFPPELGIPQDVESVVRIALEKSPEDRFSSGNAMAQALSSAIGEEYDSGPETSYSGNQASAAYTESSPAETGKSSKLKKIVLISLSLVLVSGISGVTLLYAIPFLTSAGTTAHYQNGTDFYHQQNYDSALMEFSSHISLYPDDFLGYAHRAITYQNMNQLNLAIKDYDKTIDLKPSYASTYAMRGQIHQKLEQYDMALQDYSEATQLGFISPIIYNNQAVGHHHLGNFQEAKDGYELAKVNDPTNPLFYNNLRFAYVDLQEFEKANTEWNKACSLSDRYCSETIPDPNQDPIVGGKYTGDPAKAQNDQTTSTLPIPDISFLKMTRSPTRATAVIPTPTLDVPPVATPITQPTPYATATASLPSYNDPYLAANEAYSLFREEKNGLAIAKYNKAIDLHPHQGAKYANLHGKTYSIMHRSEWYFYRGMAWFHTRQYHEAIKDFDEALKINAIYGKAQYQRGLSNQKLGRATQSRVDFDKACKISYEWCETPSPTTTPNYLSQAPPTISPTATPRVSACIQELGESPHQFYGKAIPGGSVEAWKQQTLLEHTTADFLGSFVLKINLCDYLEKSLVGSTVHFKVNGKYIIGSDNQVKSGILAAGGVTSINLVVQ